MFNSGRPLSLRATSNHSIISSLKETQMIESKSVLPAELISAILDLLPVPDLLNFARTSKRMLEMVYEDSRWVQRLKIMGVWNESEARKRIEETVKLRREIMHVKNQEANRIGIGVETIETSNLGKTSTILFDERIEELQQTTVTPNNLIDRVENRLESHHLTASISYLRNLSIDPEARLNVFSEVKSIRGSARIEFAKIYVALAQLYNEIVRLDSYNDLAIFRIYQNPEQQARILAHLQKFGKSDGALGWKKREDKLLNVVRLFESTLLREFELGYDKRDIDGRMRRYAHILTVLNGGRAAVEIFVQRHEMFTDPSVLGSPMDCINQTSAENFSVEPFKQFLKKLGRIFNELFDVIDRVFPPSVDMLQIFLDKFAENILSEYVIPLLSKVYERSADLYVKAVPGLLEQSLQFGLSLKKSGKSSQEFPEKIKAAVAKVFEPLTDLYLEEETKYFKKCAEMEVSEWESKLSAYDANTESFFMASFNRQSDKKDFLSSFKKVVMMPVNVLPLVSILGNKPAAGQQFSNTTSLQIPVSPFASRPQTPSLDHFSMTKSSVAPTDELSAKAALMASRLEGIRSLISFEVALNVIHAAKASIERACLFMLLSCQASKKVREECSLVYKQMIHILGQCHIKSGFDKAIDHLSKYKPREALEHQQGVAPLVTFLELVNVADLISQMIDVFYEQQLCGNKLADRNDCFNPAAQAKISFEQMLDKRVAAGLNKGIDVLMDEVEYLFGTVHQPTDYNPTPTLDGNFEVGPSKAAELAVNLVESHTKMLVGSTDKNMLDVFNQEVGLRLFTVICRHLKRQRISVNGSMKLISDMNLFFLYIKTLKNTELLEYFKALKALGQIYLIAPNHAKEIADVVADTSRFGGIFRAEELYEYVQRRADWYSLKKDVEKAMYGIGCSIM